MCGPRWRFAVLGYLDHDSGAEMAPQHLGGWSNLPYQQRAKRSRRGSRPRVPIFSGSIPSAQWRDRRPSSNALSMAFLVLGTGAAEARFVATYLSRQQTRKFVRRDLLRHLPLRSGRAFPQIGD